MPGRTNWMPCQRSRQFRPERPFRPGGDFRRCEAEPDKACEGEQQVEDGPEEVGRAPRPVAVRRREEQHGGPGVGNEEAGEGDAEERDDHIGRRS